MANAKEVLDKIKSLVGLNKEEVVDVETPAVETKIETEKPVELEIKPKDETLSTETLAEDVPIDEPVPTEEEPTEEVSIEDRVVELETKIMAIEEMLQLSNDVVEQKDEKIEELNSQIVELSKEPITEPIQVESETKKATFASAMIERQKEINKSKGKSY